MDNRIIQYYEGSLSPEEKRKLLIEAGTNEQLRRDLVLCKQLNSLVEISAGNTDEIAGEESYRRFMAKRHLLRLRKTMITAASVAAAVALIVAATLMIKEERDKASDCQNPPVLYAQTPPGCRTHVALPDGTSVWLNAGSTLTYPASFGDERVVSISGEGLFDVASDPLHPFIVETGKLNVRAIGTKFNISNYASDNLVVSLLEGSVAVFSPKCSTHELILKPSEQVAEIEGKYVKSSFTDSPAMWVNGYYYFHDKTLEEIIDRLMIYYDVNIVVSDDKLLGNKYTGKFHQADGVMDILRILQKIYPFKIRRDDDTTIYITSK